MFLEHFASKNQLPGLFINGTLVENWLKPTRMTQMEGFDQILLEVNGKDTKAVLTTLFCCLNL